MEGRKGWRNLGGVINLFATKFFSESVFKSAASTLLAKKNDMTSIAKRILTSAPPYKQEKRKASLCLLSIFLPKNWSYTFKPTLL